MIISRAPVRITLGGGGTDLPSYYEKYGGFLVAGTINKYCFVTVNEQFYDTYRIKGYTTEEVEKIDNIKHNLYRESLKYLKIKKGTELTSLSDVPSGTGLGSSGAFLVSLLNSLYLYKEMDVSKRSLAEDACKIELDILKEHEGKQDKYVSAFGGIKAYEFQKNGDVSVIPLANEDIIKSELEKKLMVFFTGRKRKKTASDALKNQDEKTKKGNKKTVHALHEVKEIGKKTKKAFEQNDFDAYGRSLHKYWQIKKELSPPKDKFIEKCYNHAMENGALGGKVMGANTDVGFFMFYYPGGPKGRWNFESEMKKLGLRKMDFTFDKEGVTTLFNGGR